MVSLLDIYFLMFFINGSISSRYFFKYLLSLPVELFNSQAWIRDAKMVRRQSEMRGVAQCSLAGCVCREGRWTGDGAGDGAGGDGHALPRSVSLHPSNPRLSSATPGALKSMSQ